MEIRYEAPGPESAKFLLSTASVQAICGPIGSGKTTLNLMKHVLLAARQQPSPQTVNGMPVRKYKLGVLAPTYRWMWDTLLPSWFKRIDRSVGAFNGGENGPASHRIRWAPGDGTVVDYWIEFVAIGENAAEAAMGGLEVTAFYMPEMPLHAAETFTYARGRTGRYPDMAEGGPTWHGITGDMNAPEMGNWTFDGIKAEGTPDELRFDGFFGKLPEGFEVYRQPSGFHPDAENVVNLPENYYRNAAIGQPRHWIARMIENKPGYSRNGKPVYPEFDDTLHVARESLTPVRGRQLIVGIDAGLSPAAAICQQMPSGQWRVLAELVCEPGVGPRRFGQRLKLLLAERFPEQAGQRARPGAGPAIVGWADPSSVYGADKADGERDWCQKVAAEAGIAIRAAPSNNIHKRTEAVRLPLTRLIEGEPSFLLSPDCVVLRKGFNAGYKFKQVRAGGEVRDIPEIDKNVFSHVHDALQYAALGGGAEYDADQRRADQFGGARQVFADNEDHPGGEFEGGRWQ